jgi:hypothetical protein
VRIRELSRESNTIVAGIVPMRQVVNRQNRALGGVHHGLRSVCARSSRAQYDRHLKRHIPLDGTHLGGIEGMGHPTSSDTSTAKFAH